MENKEKELDEIREKEYLKKLEAALFISGRWLSLQQLVMLTDINPILIRQLMDKLVERYAGEEMAIDIVKKEDMWKMDVKSEYVEIVNRLASGSSEFSKAEQETLAIIAYKQPIKQSVVVKIRGNKAYDHIKKFVSLGLIKGKKFGRTKELSLSEEFYDYFHLRNQKISDLDKNK
jgi:segregation and condensation protein B